MSMIKCSSLGLRDAFDHLDADRDGRISGDDLRAFYSTRRSSDHSSSSEDDDMAAMDKYDKEMIEMMITVADSNEDGFVQYNEFQQLLCSSSSLVQSGGPAGVKAEEELGEITSSVDDEPAVDPNWLSLMGEMFRIMDTDGDGKISFGDLKRYMESTIGGRGLSDDDVNAMVMLGGGSQDGYVLFDGFMKILAAGHSRVEL